jgi:hypothetical protein
MTDPASRFLSCEDRDLATLSDADFDLLAAAAFRAAQATNQADAHVYRHGCIAVEPGHEDLLPMIRSGAM